MTEPRDEFMVYLPAGGVQPRHCYGRLAVERALDELGRTFARVRRITENELARDLTHTFQAHEPDDDEVESWTRLHTRHMARSGAFGRR